MTIRDHLHAIRAEYGTLTPAVVVESARPEDSPLHHRFEWDDTTAAEAYRKVQAGDLIRSVGVVYKETKSGPKSVRAFHAVKDEAGNHVYEPIEAVMEDEFMRQLVLRDMEREWKSLKGRFDNFKEFWRMVGQDVEEKAS